MADAADSKSVTLKSVRVQVPPPALSEHPVNQTIHRVFLLLKRVKNPQLQVSEKGNSVKLDHSGRS